MLAFLLLGSAVAFGNHYRGNPFGQDGLANPDGLEFEALAIFAQSPGLERPRPHPRRPTFFVGTFRSVPSRDWQINMYKVYNLTGFPVSYVDEVMNITIVDLHNGTFRFIESAGNTTFYDLNFELNSPVVVNGTNSSSDGQYTFNARPFKLSILSNTSLGANRADMQFGAFGRSSGVDVVYRLLDQNITGARHFRRVRRNPTDFDREMPIPVAMPEPTEAADSDDENDIGNFNNEDSQPMGDDQEPPEPLA